MEPEYTDVVVVGAGPVGLWLAAELASAGVVPVVLERLPAPNTEPKARGIGPLATEALRRRGLGPALEAHHPDGLIDLVRAHGSARGHFAHINKISFPSDRDRSLIWQPQLEQLLGEHATRLGVRVRRGHAVTALHRDPDTVTVTVDTPDGEYLLTCRHLVGCDGGRSRVRGLAGFDFPGVAALSVTRGAEVELADPGGLPPSGPRENGMLMHGGGLLGTTEYGPPARAARDDAPLDAAELSASVARLTGHRPTITALRSPRRFTDGARQVSTYRRDRVLLAGDAAHVHSPNGGQGLDLGLMDATNLGWKLAAVATGQSPHALLDTYTAERHPVATHVLTNTMAQAALLTPGPHHEALHQIVSELMDLPDVERYFVELMTQLTHRCALPYTGTRHDPDDPTGRQVADVVVATPHATTTLYALSTAGRALLLHPREDEEISATARPWTRQIDIIGHTALAADWSAALIRPDGMIAWSAGPGRPVDLDLLATALRTWHGTPD